MFNYIIYFIIDSTFVFYEFRTAFIFIIYTEYLFFFVCKLFEVVEFDNSQR